MRVALRALLTLAAMGVALVVGVATPATGAPPEKQTGTFATLFSHTSDCTDQTGGTVCTEINLDVTSQPEQPDMACLSIVTSLVPNGGQGESVTYESGCSPVESVFTVTDALSATLQPTPITIGTHTCDPEDECTVTDERTVTVSASDTATGPLSTSRSHGVTREGDCTFRYKSTSASAPVAGTITIDGVTYEETGSVSKGQFRVASRDCDKQL